MCCDATLHLHYAKSKQQTSQPFLARTKTICLTGVKKYTLNEFSDAAEIYEPGGQSSL